MTVSLPKSLWVRLELIKPKNVMAATYPEMFAAGIAYSGTGAGCYYSGSGGTDSVE